MLCNHAARATQKQDIVPGACSCVMGDAHRPWAGASLQRHIGAYPAQALPLRCWVAASAPPSASCLQRAARGACCKSRSAP
jgi:hypothetical protein